MVTLSNTLAWRISWTEEKNNYKETAKEIIEKQKNTTSDKLRLDANKITAIKGTSRGQELKGASLVAQMVKNLPAMQVPGLGRSAGEGIGNPLQYSWASPVAQLVKNLPVMWETWV